MVKGSFALQMEKGAMLLENVLQVALTHIEWTTENNPTQYDRLDSHGRIEKDDADVDDVEDVKWEEKDKKSARKPKTICSWIPIERNLGDSGSWVDSGESTTSETRKTESSDAKWFQRKNSHQFVQLDQVVTTFYRLLLFLQVWKPSSMDDRTQFQQLS